MVDLITEFLDSLRSSHARQKAAPVAEPPALQITLPGATREAVQRQIDVMVRFVDRGGGSLDVLGPMRLDVGWGAVVMVHEVSL